MKLRTFPTLLALGVSAVCAAETIDVTTFSYAGPYAVTSPYMMDSVDMSARKYEVRSKLSTPVSLDLAARGRQFTDSVLPATKGDALHLLSFTLDNSHYASARLKVTGIRNYEMYVDGKKYSGNELKLTPRTRENISLDELKATWMAKMNDECVFISAKEQINIDELKNKIYEKAKEVHITRFPYNDFLFQKYDEGDDPGYSEPSTYK